MPSYTRLFRALGHAIEVSVPQGVDPEARRFATALDRVFPDYAGASASAAREEVTFPSSRVRLEIVPAPDAEGRAHGAAEGTAEGTGSWLLRATGAMGTPDSIHGPFDAATVFSVLDRRLADLLALHTRNAMGAEGEEATLVHAAGAIIGDRAVLVAGESGSGKSSVAAALAKLGNAALGDDAVLLGARGLAFPYKRLFKIHEGAKRQLALPDQAGPLEAFFEGADFYHPRQLGSAWADPTPIGHIVFARRGDEGGSLRPVSEAVGVRRLLDLSLGPADRARTLAHLVRATQGVDFWDLDFERCDVAAAQLVSTFGLHADSGRSGD